MKEAAGSDKGEVLVCEVNPTSQRVTTKERPALRSVERHKMKDRFELLIGRWETWDQDSLVVYEIRKTGRRIRLRAFDKMDGEEYKVERLRWDGHWLSFEVFVPSTRYRTRNRIRPVSKTKFIQEFTFSEPWRKVGAD